MKHLTRRQLLGLGSYNAPIPTALPFPAPIAFPTLHNWRLQVSIDGTSPQFFTLAELHQNAHDESMRSMVFNSNPITSHAIFTASWRGIRLSHLLDENSATFCQALRITTLAGQQRLLPIDDLPSVFVATHINKKPTSTITGEPFQLLVPDVYALTAPCIIRRIDIMTTLPANPVLSPPITPLAIIQYPTTATTARHMRFGGVAFAGKDHVQAVYLRIDGGHWMPTQLICANSPLIATKWHFDWRFVLAGSYHVEVRATTSNLNADDNHAQHHAVIQVVESAANSR